MEAEILINRGPGETRVAVLEDGSLREAYFERDLDLSVVGNIYLGRVSRVLPGMQAAFVNVSLDRAAFLHAEDVLLPGGEPDEPEIEDGDDAESPAKRVRPERPSIGQLLRDGQEVVVQVAKAPLGTKGARVTSYVSLPGRYVVYMPTATRVGVSRKITSEAERKRLKALVESMKQPGDGGFIVRTVCEGLDGVEIGKDMELLRALWAELLEKKRSAAVPSLLLADLDLVLRTARDLFTEEVKHLYIDQEQEAQRIRSLLQRAAPQLADRVVTHTGPKPLFEVRGIEQALESALGREIQLKSGASIVIDETEALTAIDVNTGSFVGSKDLEATILKTNLEAAVAVAHQIRLRNLGGIIVIDFIDLESAAHRERVHTAFVAELAKDRAKTHALPMSEFGVVEMTRRRVRPSLGRTLTEPCPYCQGRGRVRSRTTMCHDVLREVERQAAIHPHGDVVVSVMPSVAVMLTQAEMAQLEALEQRIGRAIVVEARSDLHQEVFDVSVRAKSIIP